MNYVTIGKKKFVLQNPYLYAFVISLIFAVICLISFFRLSILSSFSPLAYSSDSDIDTYYDDNCYYVRCNIDKLYYTGYDYISHNKISGHYYYTLHDSNCTIYLLSADFVGAPNNPPVVLENLTFNATLKKNDSNFKTLLEYMAEDLSWNYQGLLRHTSTTIVDQRDYKVLNYILLSVFTFASIVLTLITAILVWHHSDYILKIHHHHKKDE